jgi:hypothetical protein
MDSMHSLSALSQNYEVKSALLKYSSRQCFVAWTHEADIRKKNNPRVAINIDKCFES